MSAIHPEMGDKVQLISDRGGHFAVLDPDRHGASYAFADHIFADVGDVGEYAGKHPKMHDWHMVLVEIDGHTYECPVHQHQFEVIG